MRAQQDALVGLRQNVGPDEIENGKAEHADKGGGADLALRVRVIFDIAARAIAHPLRQQRDETPLAALAVRGTLRRPQLQTFRQLQHLKF